MRYQRVLPEQSFGIVGALLYVAIRNHGRVGEISTRGLVLMAGLSLYYGFTAQGWITQPTLAADIRIFTGGTHILET